MNRFLIVLVLLSSNSFAQEFTQGNMNDDLFKWRKQQVKSVFIQMKRIESVLKQYRMKCGMYPSSEQGLEALVSKPSKGKDCKRYPDRGFVAKLPIDPWDNKFIYESSDGKTFSLTSYGADGKAGGDNFNKDFSFPDKKELSQQKRCSEQGRETYFVEKLGGQGLIKEMQVLMKLKLNSEAIFITRSDIFTKECLDKKLFGNKKSIQKTKEMCKKLEINKIYKACDRVR